MVGGLVGLKDTPKGPKVIVDNGDGTVTEHDPQLEAAFELLEQGLSRKELEEKLGADAEAVFSYWDENNCAIDPSRPEDLQVLMSMKVAVDVEIEGEENGLVRCWGSRGSFLTQALALVVTAGTGDGVGLWDAAENAAKDLQGTPETLLALTLDELPSMIAHGGAMLVRQA